MVLSRKQKRSFLFSTMKKLVLDSSDSGIQLENNSDTTAYFKLKINDKFPLSINEMINEIKAISAKSNVSEELVAWSYVSGRTFYSKPYTLNNWPHHPEIFVNSLGGGLCDDVSSVLVYLYHAMGYKARVVGLNGHVVAEVFAHNKWEMFDVDHRIYYGHSNHIASVAELSAHPNWVANPSQNHTNQRFNLYTFRTNLSKALSDIYAEGLHTDDTEWHLNTKHFNDTLILPPNSILQFLKANHDNLKAAIVRVGQNSLGKIQIPLVPYYATGTFQFSINDSIFSSKNGDTLWFDPNVRLDSIVIQEIIGTAQIVYLTNPVLKIFGDTNFVRVRSSQNIALRKVKEPGNPVKTFYKLDYIRAENLFDSLIAVVYRNYLVNSKPYTSGGVKDYLKNEFQQYLKSDTSLDKEQSDTLKTELISQYNSLREKLGLSEQNFIDLVNEYHPLPLYYFFCSVRYGKQGFILHKWLETIGLKKDTISGETINPK